MAIDWHGKIGVVQIRPFQNEYLPVLEDVRLRIGPQAVPLIHSMSMAVSPVDALTSGVLIWTCRWFSTIYHQIRTRLLSTGSGRKLRRPIRLLARSILTSACCRTSFPKRPDWLGDTGSNIIVVVLRGRIWPKTSRCFAPPARLHGR